MTKTELMQEENSSLTDAKERIAADLMERVANPSAGLVNSDTAGRTLEEMVWIQKYLADHEGEIGGGGLFCPPDGLA